MHFLITAGGTREYFDPVRFISNASSGKMGYALGCAAVKAGHKVTLITTVVLARTLEAARVVRVESAEQMFNAVRQNFSKCDCLIMAAAVADYTPVSRAKAKIRKSDKRVIIELKPTVDILKWAGKNKGKSKKVKGKKKRQIVVGFALDDRAIRKRAEEKLKEKRLDMVVANTPAAIGAEKSTVQIKTPESKWIRIGPASKATIAKRIIFLVSRERL